MHCPLHPAFSPTLVVSDEGAGLHARGLVGLLLMGLHFALLMPQSAVSGLLASSLKSTWPEEAKAATLLDCNRLSLAAA